MTTADLTGQQRKDTYKSLLHLDNYTNGLTASLQQVYDGDGTASVMWLSTAECKITNATITGGTITGITDLAIADGGTGASTANDALNNLLPSQATNSGKFLTTDGSNSSWSIIPSQYTDEMAQDAVATLIQNGTGITWSYSDVDGTLTPTVSIASFSTDDLSEGGSNLYYTAARFDSALASKDTDDLSEGVTNLYYTDERVDDRVSTLIQNGTGITWTYDDTANTLTPSVTVTQYTDELAQDAVGSILTDSSTIDFTYDDAGSSITASVKDASVTYAKIQNVSATDKILGRSTAGAGVVEEITCTSAGRALIDDATATDQRTTLGLGNVENTALSTWTGSSNLTTVGTVATGTWNGTTLDISYGGTGQTTANDALNALLPSQATNSGKVLQTDGSNTSWVSVGGTGTVTGGANQAQSGAGVFDSTNSTTSTLKFNEIKAASSKVTVAGGGNNAAVTVDVNESNLSSTRGFAVAMALIFG